MPVLCRYLHRRNGCKFGLACKFSHHTDAANEPVQKVNSIVEKTENNEPEIKHKYTLFGNDGTQFMLPLIQKFQNNMLQDFETKDEFVVLGEHDFDPRFTVHEKLTHDDIQKQKCVKACVAFEMRKMWQQYESGTFLQNKNIWFEQNFFYF